MDRDADWQFHRNRQEPRLKRDYKENMVKQPPASPHLLKCGDGEYLKLEGKKYVGNN